MTASALLKVIQLALFVFLTQFAIAQSQTSDAVRDIGVCELLRTPDEFDGQMVRVRGKLRFEFENETLDDGSCNPPMIHTGIWWSYGGTPLLAREPEKARIERLTQPAVNDDQFTEFNERIRAHRSKLPDGVACPSHRQCAYYEVTATFTGRFFAGKKTHGGTTSRGFGHVGCCHLFVIQQVSDVDARRTPVPDDKQRFACRSISWQSTYPKTTVAGIKGRIATNREFLRVQLQDHGDEALIPSLLGESDWHLFGITGFLFFTSPDLLTTYTAKFPETVLKLRKGKKQQPSPSEVPILMNVTREHCEPVQN